MYHTPEDAVYEILRNMSRKNKHFQPHHPLLWFIKQWGVDTFISLERGELNLNGDGDRAEREKAEGIREKGSGMKKSRSRSYDLFFLTFGAFC